MKWNLPKEDKIKVSRNFALFPIEMDEGKKIWLEFYYSCEIYCNNYWLNVARSQHLGILRRQFHKWRMPHRMLKKLRKMFPPTVTEFFLENKKDKEMPQA